MLRLFLITAIIIFGVVGVAAYVKNRKSESVAAGSPVIETTIEIDLEEIVVEEEAPVEKVTESPKWPLSPVEISELDHTEALFNPRASKKYPFIQTVTYKSRVPWLNGRPAWISDYATHFRTSRHFIARSLHGKGQYFKHDVANGNKFNVFNPDEQLEFHLLIDVSRCKMWLFAILPQKNERYLVKTYDVGLGRLDEKSPSGLLTPLGKYTLGNRVATYDPKSMGFHNGEKVQMIRIFGTRWIPFGRELANTTCPADGYGIHGVPWDIDSESGKLVEKIESIGNYGSDGCIRLSTEDIEEIYSLIITKPSIIELVQDYRAADLPGHEVNL